jgi:hypothetical protein
VFDVNEAFSTKKEMSRIVLLLFVCIGALLAFLARFPTEASNRPMEPLTIEAYFNTGWEIDSAGSFLWVLNEKNIIIIANNQNAEKSGLLNLQIVGSPCGGSHEIVISSKSILAERISIIPNETKDIQLKMTLDPHARVPVHVDVTGEGCSPSALDDRLIRVQIREPVFLSD